MAFFGLPLSPVVLLLGLVRHEASLGLHMASLRFVLPTASLGLVLSRPAAGPGLVFGCPVAGSFHRLPLPPVLHLLHHHRVVEAAGAVGPYVQLGLGRGGDLVALGDLPCTSALLV